MTAGIQEKDGEAARTLCSIAGAAANPRVDSPSKNENNLAREAGYLPTKPVP